MGVSDEIIRVEGLSLSARDGDVETSILKDVSFSIRSGEQVSIVGPSGCGKTTLMETIATLLTPPVGRVFLHGEDLALATESGKTELRRSTIGIVFQGYHLVPGLSALENVALPLRYAGVRRAEALERAKTALDEMGLTHRLLFEVSRLSGGERQRVAIARATVHNPSLILADEPTGSLDQKTGQSVLDLLIGKTGGQRTLLMVTHSAEIASQCGRTISFDEAGVTG